MQLGENTFGRFESGTVLRASRLSAAERAAPDAIESGIVAPRDLIHLESAIRGLESRCHTPNVFHTADFLIAAGQHFRESQAPRAVVVWLTPDSGPRRLIGLLPIHKPGFDMPGGAIHSWTHPFSAEGTLMLDAEWAGRAFDAILNTLEHHYPETAGLVLHAMADAELASILRAEAAAHDREIRIMDRWNRAITTGAPMRIEESRASGRELRRQHRRLAAQGALSFRVREGYADIRTAAEDFLALEAAGWKGQRGTAIVQDPDAANFARAMLWSAAARGQVRIAELRLDGQLLASAIILNSGGAGSLWKIAYNEDFARFSPGVMLVADLTRWLRAEGTIAILDSCAHAGHRMIEGLWSERKRLVDLMVSLRQGRSASYVTSVLQERLRRSLRARARRLLHLMRDFASA